MLMSRNVGVRCVLQFFSTMVIDSDELPLESQSAKSVHHSLSPSIFVRFSLLCCVEEKPFKR